MTWLIFHAFAQLLPPCLVDECGPVAPPVGCCRAISSSGAFEEIVGKRGILGMTPGYVETADDEDNEWEDDVLACFLPEPNV